MVRPSHVNVMRPLIAFTLLGLSAFPAAAQTPELDRLRMQQLQQQNMQAQEQQLQYGRAAADLNRAAAELNRAQTNANLRALQSASPTTYSAAGQVPPPAPLSDADALRRLQDAELAASNARLRAIIPTN
jgi:hypothetical protein